MIDKIIVEPYKRHQGFGDQISYKGIPLGKAEQAILEKLNELIEAWNRHQYPSKIPLEAVDVNDKCCKEIEDVPTPEAVEARDEDDQEKPSD